MSKPALNSVATRLYDGLIPFNDVAGKDGAATSWALAYFCKWLCDSLLQDVADLALDDALGNPAWSSLLDLTRVPNAHIKYLAQFIGVKIDDALSPTNQKAQISALDGFARGSVGQLEAFLASEIILRGDTGWLLRERYNPNTAPASAPYDYQVIISTANLSPSPDPTLLGLQQRKPAGLRLWYSRTSLHDWQYIKDHNAHWSDVTGTWNTVLG